MRGTLWVLPALGLTAFLPGCAGESGTSCATGERTCGSFCVNTNTDHNNCGSCGNACLATEQCRSGSCITQCVPSAESCNGVDDDCDGNTDENLTRDCSTPCGRGEESCDDGRWVACTAPTGSTETCNGQDDDCDGATDEGVTTRYYQDGDHDNYGNPASSRDACTAPANYVTDNTDCDDTRADVRPGNPEDCNGIDDNCDHATDEGCTCTPSTTQNCGEGGDTGECSWGTQTCVAGGTWGACTGGIRPATETCDRLDNDCDGSTDEGMSEDPYEVSDACAQARSLPRADEGDSADPPFSITDATLYSGDSGADVDWYQVQSSEAFHLDCLVHPGSQQCYFIFWIAFTPPAGANHSDYRACVYSGSGCDDLGDPFCMEETDWSASDGYYSMALQWSGVCGLDDSWTFYVSVQGVTASVSSCSAYGLDYLFFFEGGVGGDYCSG